MEKIIKELKNKDFYKSFIDHKKKIFNDISSNQFLISTYFGYQIIDDIFNDLTLKIYDHIYNNKICDLKYTNLIHINKKYYPVYYVQELNLHFNFYFSSNKILNKIENLFKLPNDSIKYLNYCIIKLENQEHINDLIEINNYSYFGDSLDKDINEKYSKKEIEKKLMEFQKLNIIDYKDGCGDIMLIIPLNDLNEFIKFELLPDKKIKIKYNQGLICFNKLNFDFINNKTDLLLINFNIYEGLKMMKQKYIYNENS